MDLDGLASLQFDKTQNAILNIRNGRKIRPNRTVEEIPLDRPDDRRNAENIDLVRDVANDDIVCKERNSDDMIQMGMRNKNMLDLQLSSDIQNIGKAACIKQDSPVQKKPWEMMSRKRCA
jgi:hypothetical protein